jgi:hypothetical protein
MNTISIKSVWFTWCVDFYCIIGLDCNFNIGILTYFSDSPCFFAYVGGSDPFFALPFFSIIDFVVCVVPNVALR